MPFDDSGFLGCLENAEQGVCAEFPDVDVTFHVRCCDDVVGGAGVEGGVGWGGRDGRVVPAQTVDEVLEFVFRAQVEG